MRLAPPDAALLARGAPFLRLLSEAAAELGGRVEFEQEFGYLGRYFAPDGRMRPIFGKSLGLNRDSAAAIAADKDYTARLLATCGLPTPAGFVVFSAGYSNRMALRNRDVAEKLAGRRTALERAAQLGFPLIVKPNSGSEGFGVSLVANGTEVAADLDALLATEDRVRIEMFAPGCDVRVLVLDRRAVLAYERRGLTLAGDGNTSIARLLAQRLGSLASHHRGTKISADDPRIARRLGRLGLTRDTVPAAGQRIEILDNANLSTGGEMRDVTLSLSPAARGMALRAAETLGLTVAGVDLRIAEPVRNGGGITILEVNSAPGLDYYASAGPAQWKRAREIVVAMLDRD
ncbi:hypothetical protein [Tropicimonas sp.]|uniref:hypothetical protein n=1 Tax=Tropicimonas sp. TaxID=2067044 RepID=UPI003A84BC69